MTKLYLIENVKNEFAGRLRLWWKSDRLTYTDRIDDAGRFTKSDAEEICAESNRAGIIRDKAWTLDDVLGGKAGVQVHGILNPNQQQP